MAGSSGQVGLGLSISDLSGCTASSSTNVPIFLDHTPPSIDCPSNITVTASGNCPATVNFAVSAVDDCSLASVIASPPSGSAFPVGTNTVTVIASDTAGNTNTCSFNVVVQAGPPPQLHVALSGTNVVLSWPQGFGCCKLQFTPAFSVSATNQWSLFGGLLQTNGGTIFATNSASISNRFYRLSY
jgi:hypothetical protein